MITIFKNIKDVKNPNYITIGVALKRIKDGNSRKKIDSLRKETNKKKRADIKKTLPSVCFSGKFSQRFDKYLEEHSGFVILDFDHEEHVEEKKLLLSQDEYTYAVWISPSGDGLKALIKIPANPKDHEAHYLALIDKYPELDTTSKNLSRVCYESYDSEIQVNKSSKIWTGKKLEKKKTEVKRTNQTSTSVAPTSSVLNERVLNILRQGGDGSKHDKLLQAAVLAGGFIASGQMIEHEIVNLLLSTVEGMGADDMKQAERTVVQGIEHGRKSPIEEETKYTHTKEVKKPIVIDDSKMFSTRDAEKEWISLVVQNKVPQGELIGSEHFDSHYRLKPQTMVGIFGIDNVGKTTFHHFISTCYSKKNKEINWLLICKENKSSAVRQKIMELYWGRTLSSLTKEQLEEAKNFSYDYFDILEENFEINMDNFIDVMKKIFSKKHYFGVFIDPYNAIQHDQMPSKNYKFLDSLRSFQKEYNMSFHISMHISTDKARNFTYGDKDSISDFEGNEIAVSGQMRIPRKAHVEGGQPIANKLDDIIIVHRIAKISELRCYTLVSIDKVKEEQTGGMVSFDNPIMFYKSFGYDSFIDKNRVNPLQESGIKPSPPPDDFNINSTIESQQGDSFELEEDVEPF